MVAVTPSPTDAPVADARGRPPGTTDPTPAGGAGFPAALADQTEAAVDPDQAAPTGPDAGRGVPTGPDDGRETPGDDAPSLALAGGDPADARPSPGLDLGLDRGVVGAGPAADPSTPPLGSVTAEDEAVASGSEAHTDGDAVPQPSGRATRATAPGAPDPAASPPGGTPRVSALPTTSPTSASTGPGSTPGAGTAETLEPPGDRPHASAPGPPPPGAPTREQASGATTPLAARPVDTHHRALDAGGLADSVPVGEPGDPVPVRAGGMTPGEPGARPASHEEGGLVPDDGPGPDTTRVAAEGRDVPPGSPPSLAGLRAQLLTYRTPLGAPPAPRAPDGTPTAVRLAHLIAGLLGDDPATAHGALEGDAALAAFADGLDQPTAEPGGPGRGTPADAGLPPAAELTRPALALALDRVAPGAAPEPRAAGEPGLAPGLAPRVGALTAALRPTAPAGLPLAPTETLDVPDQLVRAIRLQWRDGIGDARLRLTPPHLGEVQVALQVHQGAVSAILSADSEVVRQWIRTQQHELKALLAAQGLDLAQLVVDEDRPDRHARPFDTPPRRAPRRPVSEARFEVRV